MKATIFGFKKQQVDAYIERSLHEKNRQAASIEYEKQQVLAIRQDLVDEILKVEDAIKLASDRGKVMDAVWQTATHIAEEITQEYQERFEQQTDTLPASQMDINSELIQVETKLQELRETIKQSPLQEILDSILNLKPPDKDNISISLNNEVAATNSTKDNSYIGDETKIYNFPYIITDKVPEEQSNLINEDKSNQEPMIINTNTETPASPQTINKNSAFDSRQYKYILGNIVGADLVDDKNNLIATKGDKITDAIISRAQEVNLLVELVVDMELPDL